MKKLFKLGVIGCGRMGSSLVRGVVLSDFIREKRVAVSDPDKSRHASVEDLGVFACCDDRYVVENSDYIVVALKNQDFNTFAEKISGLRPEKVISLVPGLKKNTIKNALGIGVKVARCQLNLPCTIGSGVIAVDMSDFNQDVDDTEFITKLFDSMGIVLSTYEDKLSSIAGLAEAGPAFVFMMTDAFIDAGVKCGLTKNEAKLLAAQTFMGSAEMVRREDETIPELLRKACGKGDPSIEAVKVFEDKGLREIIDEGVEACVNRADELQR